MGVRERIKKYRQTGGAADLARVEVLVPEDCRDQILALASDMRSAHRLRNDLLRRHLDLALERYGARIADNIDLDRINGLPAKSRIVANALIERGDARAYAFGRRMLAEAGG
jgi:hypothetical protein